MKVAYPVILTPDDPGYVVYIPDLDLYTQGQDIADALSMAEDVISLNGVVLADHGEPIPVPSAELPECTAQEMATFVLVDFDAYRRANDQRAVRKNVTLPSYLNDAAEKAGLNFSRVLQDALKALLNVS